LTILQQQEIQNELLKSLKNETELKVARQKCQSIAELAGLIYSINQSWPELDLLISQFITSGAANYQELAFCILEVLWTNSVDHYIDKLSDFSHVIEIGLKSTHANVVLSAFSAICGLISTIDSVNAKIFYKYAEDLVKILEFCSENVKDEQILLKLLDGISEITENEPTFFRKNFQKLCEIILKISLRTDFENDKIRHIALESIITIFRRMPGILKKHKAQLWALCSAVFNIMVSIESEIEHSWEKPDEGFNLNDEILNIEENVNFGLITYDQLLNSLGDDEMLPIMEKVLETALSSTDWRYRNAGLMAIAQIGEYVLDPTKIKNVIPILISHLEHPHSKVRFAALYAFGIFAHDMAPDFQSEYSKIVIGPLLKIINDPIPRVQSQACAALTNLLEHVSAEITNEISPILLPKLIQIIKEGISIAKENAMTCIAAIAESLKEQFLPYYGEMFNFLLSLAKNLGTKEYNKLKGQTIECLTIISISVGKSNFLPYAQILIELIKDIQNSKIEFSKDDILKPYLLGAWQRLVLILEKDIEKYLPEIMPKILKIANSYCTITSSEYIVDNVLESLNENIEGIFGSQEITTSEIEEKEIALEMLAVFAAQLEETFAPYIPESAKIIIPILYFPVNSELRRSAARVLASFLKCAYKIERPKFIELGRYFLAELLQAHDKEAKPDVKSAEILSMKQIIDSLGYFMTKEQIDEFFKKSFDFIKDSNTRHNLLLSTKETLEQPDEEELEDSEDSCDSQYELNVESEEIYQKNVTYLIGALINTHKNESLQHISNIIDLIIKPNLKGNPNQQKVAIFAADDLLDFLGYEKLGATLWKYLAELIASYVNNSEPMLRQAACYGVGCLAKNGGIAFKEISGKCFEILASVIEMKIDKKNKLLCLGAKEAGIAAIMKILKYQKENLPMKFEDIWTKWIEFLPISQDEDEAKETHDFVIQSVMKNPGQTIGNNGENLEKLMKLFIEIYKQKMLSANGKRDLKLTIQNLNQIPAISTMLQEIYLNKLNSEQQKILEEIAK